MAPIVNSPALPPPSRRPHSPMSLDAGLVWFRRDLRLADHAALAAALKSCRRVHCVFVYDRAILDELRAAGLDADRRVEFIHAAVGALDEALRARGGGLMITHGRAADSVVDLARRLDVDAVFASTDYEPYATARDAEVARLLAGQGQAPVAAQGPGDLREGRSDDGRRHAVLGVHAVPQRLAEAAARSADVAEHVADFAPLAPPAGPPLRPSLEQLGFRSDEPRRAAPAAGRSGSEATPRRLRRPHRRLSVHARLSGAARSVVPVGAPALRHRFDPRTGAPRARARRPKAPRPGSPNWCGASSTR